MRFLFPLSTAMGFVVMGEDWTIAYANSPSPTQPTYVRYRSPHGKEVSRSLVLPALKSLQGHLQAGAL
jgi:hypothetical protein